MEKSEYKFGFGPEGGSANIVRDCGWGPCRHREEDTALYLQEFVL